eukprot:TRINITY_DN11774_c0_g1_i1.p2 TRINITY_DN11774_c0_g1~~TRINITY_DN11774_c0_g1_i1.p2  ORF type:complete len:122 (-),score=9.91 TRINITY_DN11774_c0_g1_i1:13-351(-)
MLAKPIPLLQRSNYPLPTSIFPFSLSIRSFKAINNPVKFRLPADFFSFPFFFPPCLLQTIFTHKPPVLRVLFHLHCLAYTIISWNLSLNSSQVCWNIIKNTIFHHPLLGFFS